MFAAEELTKLEEKKRLLIAESDLRRELLRADLAVWRERFGWLRSGRSAASSIRPYMVMAAGLAGLGASVVKWRALIRWVPRLFAVWRLARGFFR
jgi:hypothetical protein